jgi:histidine triad (HIT) family protein
MFRFIITTCFLFSCFIARAQSEEYSKKKTEKLLKQSPFENIVTQDPNRVVVYQDEYVVAFEPLRKQAPVHLLIVPKKRIPTMNDITDEDEITMAHLLFAAKTLADEYGVSESGYRLAINTNEDAGQSVFHIHMHLLGGKLMGPMTTQDYTEPEKK